MKYDSNEYVKNAIPKEMQAMGLFDEFISIANQYCIVPGSIKIGALTMEMDFTNEEMHYHLSIDFHKKVATIIGTTNKNHNQHGYHFRIDYYPTSIFYPSTKDRLFMKMSLVMNSSDTPNGLYFFTLTRDLNTDNKQKLTFHGYDKEAYEAIMKALKVDDNYSLLNFEEETITQLGFDSDYIEETSLEVVKYSSYLNRSNSSFDKLFHIDINHFLHLLSKDSIYSTILGKTSNIRKTNYQKVFQKEKVFIR